uniref:EF-hand domain-containing protein n=1 Tax=Graphocephala atropunctata TaxID=36148 RepID=A0A1B6LX04_9HEMI
MNYETLDLTMNPQEEARRRHKLRSFIKENCGRTHFSKKECETLLLVHYKLTKNRHMDRKYFRKVMYTLLDFSNDHLIENIFSAFDRENRLVITKESWLLGMSLLLRGSLDERIAFCFKVYDFMGEGYIKRDQMFRLLKHTFRGTLLDEDPEEYVRDLIDLIMTKMDLDRDGLVSFDDYSRSVRKTPALLEALGYCLPSRPAVYAFMSTLTPRVTTMHSKLYLSRAKVKMRDS